LQAGHRCALDEAELLEGVFEHALAYARIACMNCWRERKYNTRENYPRKMEIEEKTSGNGEGGRVYMNLIYLYIYTHTHTVIHTYILYIYTEKTRENHREFV
jgi:hypothetical protein